MSVGGAGEHLDVGAGAEDLVEPAGDHHDLDGRVFEAETLDGVVEFDVDAEVIGVRLEFVVVPQTGLGIDGHGERGNGSVDRQLPMVVLLGRCSEVDQFDAHGVLPLGSVGSF